MERGDGLVAVDTARSGARAPGPPATPPAPWPGAALARAARNPLLGVAAPLLDLAGRLRDRPPPADPAGLFDRVLAEVRRFEVAAAEAGVPAEEIRVGRYAVCATLDDVVRAGGWAAASPWADGGLVAATESDPAAAGRFFDLLTTMVGSPHLHRNELELFYACLSLGYEGRHRDRPRGAQELAHLRDRLYRLLRRDRGGADRALSPGWRAGGGCFRPLARLVPVWVVAAAAAVALLGLFLTLSASLGERADPVAARLATLVPDRPVEVARLAPPPPPTATPALATRITRALAPEIRSGALEVLPGDDGALIVRLQGNVFPGGSDELRARYRAAVERLGETLATVPGQVLVLGHADTTPVRSVRFSGAAALTEARARAVAGILERHVGAARVAAEGRGAGEPIASNDTRDGRLANRRVDVLLYPQ